MAYTVLARRYRSGTFDEVIGQDHVAQTLKKAIESGRVAHAYLFTGTRGVGKTSMARILAKALNCVKFDAPTTTPCGNCSSCEAIARGEDIDVIEIDAASNTGVDNVRDIIENARFRPARSRFKIYIIDEVHMLSKAAFNALLKIMEEPPEHVKFILATTEVDKILPTILSRCQRYDFRNIPTREIVEHLKRIVKDEKVKADEEALLLVARAGAGSMRDSLSLLDRLLSVGEKTLTADMIEQLLGMPKAAAIFGLADAIGKGDVKATLETANAIVDGGLSSDTLIASLIEHFHNLLVLATCGIDSKLVDLVGVDEKGLEAQARAFDPTALATNITILEELRRQMRSSQAGRAMLDATMARLAMAGEFATIGEMVARLNGGPPPATRAGPPVARPGTTATPPRSAQSAEKKTPELNANREPGAASEALRAQLAQALTPPSPSTHEASSLTSRDPGAAPSIVTPPVEPPPTPGAGGSEPAKDESPDELPAVGKVAAEGATRSLWQAFKKADASRAAPAKQAEAVAMTGTLEPPHLSDVKAHVLAQMPPRLAGMFGGARLVALDESSGVAKLYFTAEDAGHAHYVTRNREQYARAFEAALRRPITLEIDAEPEPEAAKATAEISTKPRVVRPNLEDVAAEHMEEALTPMIDVDAVKDDPLVAAIMARFDGARIVKVE